jgi:hypothetical protein
VLQELQVHEELPVHKGLLELLELQVLQVLQVLQEEQVRLVLKVRLA